MTARFSPAPGLLAAAALLAACSGQTSAPAKSADSPRSVEIARFSIHAKPGQRLVQPAGFDVGNIISDGLPDENPTQSIELWTATLPFDELTQGPGGCSDHVPTWTAPVRIKNYYPEMLTNVAVQFDVISDPMNHYLCVQEPPLVSSDGLDSVPGPDFVVYRSGAAPATILGSPVNDGSIPGGFADQEWAFANWDSTPFDVKGVVFAELVPPRPEPAFAEFAYQDVLAWKVLDPQGDGIDVELQHVEICPLQACSVANTASLDVGRSSNDGTYSYFQLDPAAIAGYAYGAEYTFLVANGWNSAQGQKVYGSLWRSGVYVSVPSPSELLPAGATQADAQVAAQLTWKTAGGVDPISNAAFTQGAFIDVCDTPACDGAYTWHLASIPNEDPLTYPATFTYTFDVAVELGAGAPASGTVLGWRVSNYFGDGGVGTPTAWQYFKMP